MNEASSVKSSGHRDAGQPSFSDSLGAAKQHAESNAPAEHTSKYVSGASKNGESEKVSKRVKRDQATSGIDTTHMQQVDETNTNATTLVLPTDFRAVAGESQNQSEGTAPSIDSEHSTTGSVSQMQSSSWMKLSGGTGWNQTQLTSSSTSYSNAAVVETDATEADVESAIQSPVLTQNAAAAPLVPADAKVTTAAPATPPPSPLTNAENLDPTYTATNATAAAAQGFTASAQSAPLANNAQGASSPLSINAVTAGKASNAFKTVQSLKSSPKDPVLSTNIPAGAKETDSYLSIQKEAKSGNDSTKGSATVATSQRNDHSQATQQSFVTPVVSPIQVAPVLHSQVHQQTASLNLNDANVASQQKAQDASLTSQLQQAASATPSANTEHLSTVVNSAKLMQSIGQSEMRVGMRTAEFGDISIRTSSTRDSISAQISLGHEDLAKTLTAHMPEMQTRLTTGEVVDVHIQSNHQDTSFTGGQSGAQNGNTQSQQGENSPSRSAVFSNYSSERATIAAMPATLVASAAGNASRLDIRA